MIFSNNYDRSLWLIVSGNKKVRILDFINNIPIELIKEIQKSLELYQLYLNKNKGIPARSREKINLSGKVKTPGDMLYWYNIDSLTGALIMGECITFEEEIYDKFQMTIYPLKREYYRNLESLDTCLLGDISYNYFHEQVNEDLTMTYSDTTDFNLIKLPFSTSLICSGDTVSTLKCGGKITFQTKNRYDLVNIKQTPYDYNISRLNNKNKLVRSKKINSK